MVLTKKMVFVVTAATVSLFAARAATQAPQMPAPIMDCSNMSADMQAFAGQLSASNKTMFCGKFNDNQRVQAIQLSTQKDGSGKTLMTPNESVEKVAKDNNMMNTGKTPGGCPVK